MFIGRLTQKSQSESIVCWKPGQCLEEKDAGSLIKSVTFAPSVTFPLELSPESVVCTQKTEWIYSHVKSHPPPGHSLEEDRVNLHTDQRRVCAEQARGIYFKACTLHTLQVGGTCLKVRLSKYKAVCVRLQLMRVNLGLLTAEKLGC